MVYGKFVPYCKKCGLPMKGSILLEGEWETVKTNILKNNRIKCLSCGHMDVYNEEDYFNMDIVKRRSMEER